MSTRSAIGRKTNTGFVARFCHWDGYPSGVGASLWEAFRENFKGDLAAMLKFFVDDHPAGWSSIVGVDWSQEPGFLAHQSGKADGEDDKPKRPQCYCHGDRKEKGQKLLTEKDAGDCGCEYVYAFDEDPEDGPIMYVLSSFCDPEGKFAGQKMIGAFGCGDSKSEWKVIGRVKLNDSDEPDWEQMGEPIDLSNAA